MSEKILLKVESMHCGGCVSTVEKAVLATKGVKTVKTDLGKKLVEVIGQAEPELIIKAISETGYEAELFRGEQKGSLIKRLFRG